MSGEAKRAGIIMTLGSIALLILISAQGRSSAPDRSLAEVVTGTSDTPTVGAPLSPKRFEAGDQLFKERRAPAKARAALQIYRELFKTNPQDFEAAWHVAMGCYYMAARVETLANEREKVLAEGRDVGEVAIRLSPQACAPCHFWTAIDMAMYGESVGVLKMLFSLTAIRKHLEASIAADPHYAFGGAYRLLGLIYQKVPGFFGGSNAKAKAYFLSAIASAPEEPLHYLFLARLLKDDLQDPAQAMEVAQRGLKVPTPGPDRVEAFDAVGDLKALVTLLGKTQAPETNTAAKPAGAP